MQTMTATAFRDCKFSEITDTIEVTVWGNPILLVMSPQRYKSAQRELNEMNARTVNLTRTLNACDLEIINLRAHVEILTTRSLAPTEEAPPTITGALMDLMAAVWGVFGG